MSDQHSTAAAQMLQDIERLNAAGKNRLAEWIEESGMPDMLPIAQAVRRLAQADHDHAGEGRA